MNRIIPEIVDQHAEEAAFLWLLRDNAVRAPHYLLGDLARLDNRVEAHLDGLRVAGAPAWDILQKQLEDGKAGETFAATVLAIESREEDRIATVLELGTASEERIRGLISGLGWLPHEKAVRLIVAAFDKKTPVFRRIAIAATAIHRFNPGDEALLSMLANPDPAVQARTAKAIGELGAVSLAGSLARQLASDDSACRFAAAWSIALLTGGPAALERLRQIVEAGEPLAPKALQVVLRRMSVDEASRWLSRLQQDPAQMRNVVTGAGIIGDPRWVPFLIEQMKVKPLARAAGEAFAAITGVHLAYQKLESPPPEDFQAGPTEDPKDPNVAMDIDEHLAWPEPDAVARWWQGQKKSFTDGTRYLAGKPIQFAWLNEVLRTGYQRQRAAAALELAIAQPGKPLFEVRAPGFRQQQLLK
jgi:uncharacterized protein (TIGR02270 family)